MRLILDKIFKSERLLFLFFSLLNIYPLFTLSIIPSLDGPQHLYISNVIVNLVEGNDFIQQFFMFNKIIVGNWIGHFILSFLNFIFPGAIAEKLFLSIYYLGIVYAFRYLVISINGKPSQNASRVEAEHQRFCVNGVHKQRRARIIPLQPWESTDDRFVSLALITCVAHNDGCHWEITNQPHILQTSNPKCIAVGDAIYRQTARHLPLGLLL